MIKGVSLILAMGLLSCVARPVYAPSGLVEKSEAAESTGQRPWGYNPDNKPAAFKCHGTKGKPAAACRGPNGRVTT